MIYIRKNSINNIVLTLTEKSKLSNPYFLFEFVNEYNLEATKIYWTSDDISVSTNRYNQFILIEDESGSISNGIDTILSLTTGQWLYKVYESLEQTLNISETTGFVIESGRMTVGSLEVNTSSIYY